MFEGKKYNLGDYIYLMKLFQRTERYPEMVKAINKYLYRTKSKTIKR